MPDVYRIAEPDWAVASDRYRLYDTVLPEIGGSATCGMVPADTVKTAEFGLGNDSTPDELTAV